MYLLAFSILLLFIVSIANLTPPHIRNEERFTRECTYMLKGLLAIFIVLHHLSINCHLDGILGLFLNQFRPWGIYVVGIFFFVSGYGLMAQYNSKGNTYLESFFSKRFCKLLPAFIFFTVLRKVLNYIQVPNYSLWLDFKTFILTGNGFCMWFIPALMIYYIFFYITIKFIENKSYAVWTNLLIIVVFSVLLKLCGYGEWWYVSSMCMPIGTIYSNYEVTIYTYFSKHKQIILTLLVTILVLLYIGVIKDFAHVYLRCALVSLIPIVVVLCSYNIHCRSRKLFISDISYELLFAHGLCMNQFSCFGFSDVSTVLLTIPASLLVSSVVHLLIDSISKISIKR